jgi:tripartite-type tricarboxylate transporter receptor subunit TctC
MPFLWVQPDSWVTVVMPKTSGVKSVEDLAKVSRPVVVGGTGATSLRTLRPKVAMDLFGAKHKWVTGYRGTAGLIAAAERGEIDVMEIPLASYFRLIKPMEKEGRAAVLFQTGFLTPDGMFERSPLLPDVPSLAEVLPKDKQKGPAWQAWQAAVAPQSFQSSVAIGPNVPAERLEILNKAFAEMSKDPTYQKEHVRAVQVPADAKTGGDANAAVQAGLKQLFEQYNEGVEYLKKLPEQK